MLKYFLTDSILFLFTAPRDDIKEVDRKYTIVLAAIFPFIFALRLAAPDTRLATTRGRIMSLRSLMKSSPG